MRNLKIMKAVFPPILIFIVVASIDIAAFLGLLPSINELTELIAQEITSRGMSAILFFSTLEHTVGINVYFPGAVVILIGMSSAAGNPMLAITTFTAIVFGQAIGYILSYFAGRTISNYSGLDTNLEHRAPVALLGTYFHPHSGAITSYALGSRGIGFIHFIRFLFFALLIWSPFWGLVAYYGFVNLVEYVGWDVVFYSYLIIWILLILFKSLTIRN